MPEGPELHINSCYINKVCKDVIFGGNVVKSDVNKNVEINWNCRYYISATSRGKELKLKLTELKKSKLINIIVRFGMTGYFVMTSLQDIPKHSHLRFYTEKKKSQQVLNFVDSRRFGHWEIKNEWSKDRGPDPVFEYEDFRKNVLSNLSHSAFNKPICEVLLDQRYFNGIGNYLRAEILYRAKIPPFENARIILEALNNNSNKNKEDILQLCKIVPLEVINLGGSKYIPFAIYQEKAFHNWLNCYEKKNMLSMKDHKKRTIWFCGDPGPLVPRNQEEEKCIESETTAKFKKKMKS